MQMFFAALFCVYSDYWNTKQKAKQYTENLTSKLQNSNQNSTFCWVSSISFNRALENPVQELRFVYYIYLYLIEEHFDQISQKSVKSIYSI